MFKKLLISLTIIIAISITACNQKQKPRYDANQCPICTETKGKCLHCKGTSKCSYCKGIGKRITTTLAPKEGTTKKIEIPEKCPFCEGSGKCHYCKGSGKCRVCKGTTKIDKWEW